MFNRISIITACLALAVALDSTTVRAEAAPASVESIQPPVTKAADSEEARLRIGPGDPVAGKRNAQMCFSCHGEDGNSIDPQSPKLAGQYGIYLAKQIRNYQAGQLTHRDMGTMAAIVRDSEVADVSAYFASQPMMRGARPSGNQKGKQLYENGDLSKMRVSCNSCHGTTGKGLTPDNPAYPVIGGQHREYLLMQLRKFKNGTRNNSAGGVMNTTVHSLSDAELEALADYISGL